MHPDEVSVDRPLVARLIAAQFPRWARLPLTEAGSAGTDNAIYRLGDDLAVRLPRRSAVAGEAQRLQRWLPRLAPHLPLAVAVPLACGVPGQGYPFPWLVCRWLDGQVASDDPGADLADAAVRLGRFVAALHAADATGAPPTPFRSGPLSRLDDRVRGDIANLDGTIDRRLVTAAWERALAAPAWSGGPTWVHADLSPLNLLTRRHRLAAVIDFGGLGAGDPAVDLLPAWSWLPGPGLVPRRSRAGRGDLGARARLGARPGTGGGPLLPGRQPGPGGQRTACDQRNRRRGTLTAAGCSGRRCPPG